MITVDQFNDRYITWLEEQAFATPQRRTQYRGLLRLLYDIPFYWTPGFEIDEDRAGDAGAFRRYERHMVDQERHKIPADWLDIWESTSPSVLEVFIAICERWAQFYDLPTPYFFNHLLRNLGFHIFTGPGLRPEQHDAVVWTVNCWMNRQIGRNGEGSPFPLERNQGRVDMRSVPIWDQMNAYSREHFQ